VATLHETLDVYDLMVIKLIFLVVESKSGERRKSVLLFTLYDMSQRLYLSQKPVLRELMQGAVGVVDSIAWGCFACAWKGVLMPSNIGQVQGRPKPFRKLIGKFIKMNRLKILRLKRQANSNRFFKQKILIYTLYYSPSKAEV
jgi:hypothetical protein